jgi:uncharacterized membrane protein
MNFAHLHLLLNHFPTIGFAIGLGLFFVAIAGKNNHVKQAGLGIFFLVALLTIVVYVSGNAANVAIRNLSGVRNDLIETHEDAALLAYVFMEITGLLAFLGLWQFRRTARTAHWNSPAVLLFSIVTFGLMARAANLGGEIRHPEIREAIAAEQQHAATEQNEAAAAEEAQGWFKSASIASFVADSTWVWPACETFHFIGMCILFGVVIVVNLRMLGMMKNVSFAALHRLLPLGILGFGINLITGMVFFIGVPDRYVQNAGFQWKMLLLLLAGVNTLYFTIFDEVWALEPEQDASLRAKVIAASTLILWTGVMYFGRMLPFFGVGGG